MSKKKKRVRRTLSEPKRMAKMITSDANKMINQLSEVLSEERHMESRVSDNDTIRTAVRESLSSRGLE